MKDYIQPSMLILLRSLILAALGVSTSYAGTQAAIDFSKPETGEQLSGGATTHFKRANAKAFSHPAANMPFEQQLDFRIGNGIFRKLWVAAPSSTTASDGLGPLYNARSCMQCHTRDGRGHTPDANWPEDNAVSMFLRLSIPAQNPEQEQLLLERRVSSIPEPTYGNQLQDFAVTGLQAEGKMQISYNEEQIRLADDETVSLRHPSYSITNPGFGPFHPELMISPRIAPAMIGLGLLEQIPEQAILALADPEDKNGDGISGRANQVWDNQKQQISLGRFGWKAGSPTLNQQNNSAFNGDIGISTPYSPKPSGDCTALQLVCLQMPNGNTEQQEGLEASSEMNRVLLFYSRHIAVPARRNVADPEVLKGKELFHSSGCASCHQPSFVTAETSELPMLSQQLIWPYSDMLLHDMGEGLADNRPEFAANGREWRTPPLWGIGLTKKVSGKENYLHDGRARTLLEAIIWHGGEALTSRKKVQQLSSEERNQLIKFLESL
jgi:CxxC motif-containing protein (DUF1111 family)